MTSPSQADELARIRQALAIPHHPVAPPKKPKKKKKTRLSKLKAAIREDKAESLDKIRQKVLAQCPIDVIPPFVGLVPEEETTGAAGPLGAAGRTSKGASECGDGGETSAKTVIGNDEDDVEAQAAAPWEHIISPSVHLIPRQEDVLTDLRRQLRELDRSAADGAGPSAETGNEDSTVPNAGTKRMILHHR